ncbi:hypothetical protein [Sphingobacterium sp.]|uniref:hypothetical protein n=1 Tax=Sphingobacterium sp. TaxID=341027 RepID=UPI0025D58848|nr:hypothetical protein [Sphingobacterium sp.]
MKLFEIIDKTWIGDFGRRKSDIITSTDPDKIYVENIRAFFGGSTRMAKFLCDLAVRTGHFTKHIGFECPNCHSIIKTIPYTKNIKLSKVKCSLCEIRDEGDFEFDTSKVDKIVFYRLKEGSHD